MRKYKTVIQEPDELNDIFCDCCGNSLRKKPSSNCCGIHFLVSGNYSSKHFIDMPEFDVNVDVCENCAAEWFKTFKNNPLDYPEDQ